MTDPIADMLTRIRNASRVKKKEVAFPYSKLKMAIATILMKEGYVTAAEESKEQNFPMIVITLKYANNQPAIRHLGRVSTPGHRSYVKKDRIRKVLNGYGFSILSTPRGVMTNTQAVAANVGGEVLCEVY